MVDGDMILTSKGAPGGQSNRLNEATTWAFFAQDQMKWGRWTLSPDFRYENIELLRTDFSKSDPERKNPTRTRSNDVNVFIPGLGINFALHPAVGFSGGIHKGFAPPGPGSNENIGAESSLNYEFGLRFKSRRAALEIAGFFNESDNLLGADTLSAGGTGEGDPFNGGEVLVKGLEASGSFDLIHTLPTSLRLPVRFAYTFTDAHFQNTFTSQFERWGNVVAGNELPYLPRHQFHAALGCGTATLATRVGGQRRKELSFHPCWRISTCTTSWIFGSTSDDCVLEFEHRQEAEQRRERGEKRLETFTFLGFLHM
jgi:Fe(3+) dicitrate transport protein